uniref:Pleckstrin homology domain-containing family M member 2 n=1 Tax=Callorhinchus milii TaxID=7868 RepID=A0A4W3J0J8_CALMI
MQILAFGSRRQESVKISLQGYFAACEDETPAIRNHDKVLQRLCEHLDHALLYGLQDISSGYWVLVVHFTRSEAVKQIEVQQHVATNLGRSRAWLYLALNENSLESYLRLFWENQTLLHKYYFKNALVCSDDHLTLFLTLVSGLEFIRFELDLDVPYLDVAPYMPEYYKPHNLLDFEERLPNSVQGSDSLSLNSFNSVTSTNLEWDDSAIAPSSEDYDFGDVFPAAHSMPSTDWEGGTCISHSVSTCCMLSKSEQDFTSRLAKDQNNSLYLQNCKEASGGEEGSRPRDKPRYATRRMSEADSQPGLLIPQMKDTSMNSVGNPLSEVIERLNGTLDDDSWTADNDQPEQPFRTGIPGDTPDEPPYRGYSERKPPTMDFYRFALESPGAGATSGSDHDTSGDGQQAHVFSSYESADSEALGYAASARSLATARMLHFTWGRNISVHVFCPHHFRVDNNLLLLLMIHVFRENEEQLYKMMRMWSGHMEGNLQLLYVLLTDCYIYLLRKGVADKPYNVEEAVSYNELDYISVGLGQQTVQLVCTNRRRQFLLDTADETLTEFFLSALKSAMIKGCREPPYPSILTDATMQRLALTKFVAQESKCEPSEVTIHLYSLIHWEDPLDITAGPQGSLYMPGANSVTKEGLLHYKAGTTYLGSPIWKSSYVVLSNGILYQYPDRTDMMPIISINLAGEQCGGCRRSSITERPHTFHVILTERPALELSAESEKEMADWMQHLCQAVSKGIIPQGVAPSPCIPCCLVVTERLVITCHEDSQTSFFRSLGSAELISVSSISIDPNGEYCLMEFSEDQKQTSPPWFLYFSCAAELERFITALNVAWRSIYQVDLPQKQLQEPCVQRKCEDAVLLIRTTWQRSDSLHRGRSERDPWC